MNLLGYVTFVDIVVCFSVVVIGNSVVRVILLSVVEGSDLFVVDSADTVMGEVASVTIVVGSSG